MSKTGYEIVVKAAAWFVLLDQVRTQAADEADAQLTESIRLHGILQPLGARPDGKLVWGHRRLRCGVAAGLTDFPTVVLHKDMEESEYLVLQMLENVQRSDLSPYDLWQGCVRLLETNKDWRLGDVAKALSLDPASVTRIMSPSKAVPAVVEALRSGRIGLSTVYAITKADSPQDQERLLHLSLAGTSRDGIENAVKRAKTAAKPAATIARVKCPLNTGVVVTVTGPEMTLDQFLAVLTQARELAMKSSKDNLDIKTAMKVWADKAKAN